MKPTDLSDATARALDQLPPGDPAGSDPRLLRDPQLIEEARLTRETAAAVWLATSPLRVAPPDVLSAVMAEIRPPASTESDTRHRYLPWLAVSGWAAAAVIAISLWPKPSGNFSNRNATSLTSNSPPGDPHTLSAAAVPASRDSKLRKEILRMQNRLATFQDEPNNLAPRVMSLTAPGAVRRTPGEARQRVQSILTSALRSALEAESSAQTDTSSLVIERGWLPGGVPLPSDGGVIRHRNFPEQAWREMGLLRSANGEYYDTTTQTIWSSDPDGGGFIGRKITGGDDIAGFNDQPEADPLPKPRTLPEGFAIEDPVERTTEVVIDQLPAPSEGTQHVIVLTDSAGHTETIPILQPSVPEPQGDDQIASNSVSLDGLASGSISFSVPGGVNFTSTNQISAGNWIGNAGTGSGTLVLTLQNSDLSSFQLIERPSIPTGQPDHVIVEGGP